MTGPGRRLLHIRRIEMQGFEREDGLFDIEGRLVDTKSYPFTNRWRGTVEPGVPLHDMALRLTVDEEFVIHEVEAGMDATPYEICPVITEAFQKLVGLRIAAGFNREVQARVGGVRGCTHLVELVGRLATVAHQTIGPLLARRRGDAKEEGPPRLGGCHALRPDGPIARQLRSERDRNRERGRAE